MGAKLAPSYVGRGNAITSNIAITFDLMPTAQGNTVLAGDILLLYVETENESFTVTGGTETWALVVAPGQGAASGATSTRLSLYWARASQNSPTSPTVSDSGDHQSAVMFAFRGCAPTGNPWDVFSSGSEAVADTSGSIDGATTTVPNTLVLVGIATSLPDASVFTNFDAWANADLTNFMENEVDFATSAGTGGAFGFAIGEKPVAGAFGATTVTLATAAHKSFITIALKP